MKNRTIISENNMAFLAGEDKSPRQIVQFLNEGALFRSFGQVLRQVYPGDDLVQRLTRGLCGLTGEDQESVGRKVRNWMKGQNLPKNREILFQICFVLGLDEAGANKVLGAGSDTGIHYRNPGELAYAYGLRTKKGYGQAKKLKEQALALCAETMDQEDPQTPSVFTRQIQDVFGLVEDDEGFFDFFREYAGELGALHETAYAKFMELMNCLQQPDGEDTEEERRYTMEEVVRNYIRMNVPQTKKVSGYTLLQRLVKKYWPNEKSLINIRGRKEDVSRKVLILLYLVTEAFDQDQEEDDCLDLLEEMDADTLLEMRIEKMNLFLDSYGMNCLDAGNPFDFLVLYALKTQEGDFVSERMEAVLDALFEEQS